MDKSFYPFWLSDCGISKRDSNAGAHEAERSRKPAGERGEAVPRPKVFDGKLLSRGRISPHGVELFVVAVRHELWYINFNEKSSF